MKESKRDKHTKEEKKDIPQSHEGSGGSSPKESSEVILSREEFEQWVNKVEELEGMRERMLRSAADFENAKKRLAREKEDYVRYSRESFIRELLPVLDNFERALSHAGEIQEENQAGIVTGIQMVLKQLNDILKNHGLKKMETLGATFDPHFHEAVAYVQEEGESDIIMDEIESGYLLHDKLLRAAKVRVRIAPQNTAYNPSQDVDEKRDEIT